MSTAPDDYLLTLDQVSLSFGGLLAVKDVSFAVARGQIKALIGPNGAGKTTLFNLITGILTPEKGAILFQGEPLQGLAPHLIAARGVSRTFQIVQLFSHMTALENVMVGRHVRTRAGLLAGGLRLPWTRREEAAIRDQADAWLTFVGLDGRGAERAANLPLGHQRLLEISRALATEPRLLLLDEPAAGLDPVETDRLMELIFAIRDRGISVLLVEHDMSLTMEVADDIVVLDYGSVIAEGPPREVQRNPAVIAAYLGTDWQT